MAVIAIVLSVVVLVICVLTIQQVRIMKLYLDDMYEKLESCADNNSSMIESLNYIAGIVNNCVKRDEFFLREYRKIKPSVYEYICDKYYDESDEQQEVEEVQEGDDNS